MYARSIASTVPAAAAMLALLMPTLGAAEGLQTLRTEGGTITFRVAQQQGFFEKHGIKIQKEDSGTGAAMNVRLGKGEIDVVDGGLDNGIAATLQGVDAVIVTGSSLAGQELVAQPGIRSIKDLRGKTIAVDSTDMQAALVLKKMLLAGGLKPKDYTLKVVGANRLKAMREDKQYAAAMLAGAQSLLAKQEGFISLGNSLDVVGPVTYHGVFVRRSWARDNADVLTRYIAAEIEAQRWILLPANKQKVVAFILKTSPEGTTDAMAEDVYREMVNGPGELTKDIRLEVPALQNFLKLRAEVQGSWQGSPPPAEKFYDSSYYYKALDLVSH
ncbi:ABC transporter substrate-binding protein [Steroidobacter sp.]|uniref:ABC transporter substrate-binding protein n=1 Tax=Steroidobacter sp. TaxID=1978227 RepID=UPI001A46DEF5|nr:ABC transporter substrate-binding protein [Steroidobacter sp.]MBL8266420.1 ABC transporter substrate-binding protein [Steroidobacter sp.]